MTVLVIRSVWVAEQCGPATTTRSFYALAVVSTMMVAGLPLYRAVSTSSGRWFPAMCFRHEVNTDVPFIGEDGLGLGAFPRTWAIVAWTWVFSWSVR